MAKTPKKEARVTTAIPTDLKTRLEEAAAAGKVSGQWPGTESEIVREAVDAWLKKKRAEIEAITDAAKSALPAKKTGAH